MTAVLLTGGAGYIGSHTARELVRIGANVVVLDNLSTGFRELVPPTVHFYQGDIADASLVSKVIETHHVERVIHFAASTSVDESVRVPFKYYENNFSKAAQFLKTVTEKGIREFVFSSTAAVYGIPQEEMVTETSPTLPVSPYGRSKLMFEMLLKDASFSSPLRYVVLRYFNVAGAHSSNELGQISRNATHLIKKAVETACGWRKNIEIFGTDYPTKDGTGVRDYIHVQDLADAHLLALEYLKEGGKSDTFNCGYGFGYSVKEVLQEIESLSDVKLPVRVAERRPGDIPALVAMSSKIRSTLGWTPKLNHLSAICGSALRWEQKRSEWEKLLRQEQ